MTASANHPAAQPRPGRDGGERALPGGVAEAGAAATGGLDNGDRAPPGG